MTDKTITITYKRHGEPVTEEVTYDLKITAREFNKLDKAFVAIAYADGTYITRDLEMWYRKGRYRFFGAEYVHGITPSAPVYVVLKDIESNIAKLQQLRDRQREWAAQFDEG